MTRNDRKTAPMPEDGAAEPQEPLVRRDEPPPATETGGSASGSSEDGAPAPPAPPAPPARPRRANSLKALFGRGDEPEVPPELAYRVGPADLARMIDHQEEGVQLLRLHQGVCGLAADLHSDVEYGVHTDVRPPVDPEAAPAAASAGAAAAAAAPGPRPRAATQPPLKRAQTTAINPGTGPSGSLYRSAAAALSDPDLLKEERKRLEAGLAGRGNASLLSPTEREYLRETARPSHDVRTASRAKFGWNRLPPADFKPLLTIIWEALADPTLIMLVVAAILSLGVGIYVEGAETGWTDGAAVLVAVAVVVAITALNDYQKERQFRELNDKKNDHSVRVVRNGRTEVINVQKIVVGDLVELHRGDVVPADGVLVKGADLLVDESSATGESVAVEKGLPPGCWNGDQAHRPAAAAGTLPFFLSGTVVTSGRGVMLALAVGEQSFHGRTMMSLRAPAQETPLQKKLTRMANFIGIFGVVAAAGIFVAQLIKYFVVNRDELDLDDTLQNSVEFLVIAIAIVVVAVPEGLPLAVTISLAYSMKRMMADNNLVRRLDACETMGSATYICSDKTGTLTTNKMTVQRGWYAGRRFDLAAGDAPAVPDAGERPARLAHECVVHSTSASKDMVEETNTLQWNGSQTECGLLRFVERGGVDATAWRKASPALKEFPFNSSRKRSSAVVRTPSAPDGRALFFTSGASEVVLSMCSRVQRAGGEAEPLGEAERRDLEAMIEQMAGDTLRTMCLAYRETAEDDLRDWTEEDEPGLVCLGVVGMSDPLRTEVPDAVRKCQDAGVKVVMVTGDNPTTALNIARGCGIFDPERDLCLQGREFREMDEDERKRVAPGLRVLARSSPTDKLALVATLQSLNEVVAVTGDGVNDAPALRRADVGFSMGISGTDVAKEASAIVLMDDNFVSLVNAIKWGRNVFDSVRKFLQFQLTVNFAAILFVTVVVLADEDGDADNTPLQTVQLLWINLIMDSFAAVALATEPPTEELLTFEPYGHDEPLVNPYMRAKMAVQVVMQTATFLTLIYKGAGFFESEFEDADGTCDQGDAAFSRTHYTVVFAVFVYSQLFNELNARKVRPEINVLSGLSRHPLFIGVWLFSFGVQALIVEFGGSALHVCPLSGSQWLKVLVVSVLPLLWNLVFNVSLFMFCGAGSRPVSRLEQAVQGAGGAAASGPLEMVRVDAVEDGGR